MSKMRKDQFDRWSKFFTEFWKLVKEYRNPEPDQEWWNALIEKIDATCNKHTIDGEHAMRCMVVGFLKGLDEEWQEKNGIHK